MCVNCLSSVDVIAWSATGTGAAMSAMWHGAKGQVRAARPDLERFVADLQSPPPEPTPSQWRADGPGLFLLSLASYVVAGVLLKSAVLNWVVGPLYLVTVLHALPTAGRTLATAVRG